MYVCFLVVLDGSSFLTGDRTRLRHGHGDLSGSRVVCLQLPKNETGYSKEDLALSHNSPSSIQLKPKDQIEIGLTPKPNSD